MPATFLAGWTSGSSRRKTATGDRGPGHAMEHHPTRRAADHDDDLIFEHHRQPQRVDVETPARPRGRIRTR